ncbi:hypothetical protein Vafri_6447 [Volvox africanus]|uniref:Uncharacterized protein n=1 Tax=Volvox africanus TaxID=51714 RepID=A0A8J4EZL6_9CHLO|nr:hypothetical protein Vafri_6447 [Volvox africanus]
MRCSMAKRDDDNPTRPRHVSIPPGMSLRDRTGAAPTPPGAVADPVAVAAQLSAAGPGRTEGPAAAGAHDTADLAGAAADFPAGRSPAGRLEIIRAVIVSVQREGYLGRCTLHDGPPVVDQSQVGNTGGREENERAEKEGAEISPVRDNVRKGGRGDDGSSPREDLRRP